MGTLWPQNWNFDQYFACNYVISSHRAKQNLYHKLLSLALFHLLTSTSSKLKKVDIFACNCVISSYRIKCNISAESFYEGHFFFPHWRPMSNIWGHYDLKAWKFDDLTVLCAVWFTYLFEESYLWNHELINICWPSRLRWRSNWNLLTVACNCSILVIIISFICCW